MSDNKIIGASIQVNTGNSDEQVNKLAKDTQNLNDQLDKTSATAAKTGEQVKGAGTNFGKLKDQMSALPGPLGQATTGVSSLSKGFTALLANPVGAILAAIVATLYLLYKAFTNTFEGAQKVEQVFAGIKAAGQALLDNLEKIGSAIVKIFSFDFSGAMDDINAVVDAAGNAYNAMAKLTKTAQELKKEQLQNDLDAAERAAKLAKLREQATDDTVSLAKRKAALKELKADAEENAKGDLDLARRTAENKIAMLTLEKDGAKKNAEEITKIKIEQINGEVENANQLRTINKQITAAEKQELAERKAAQQAANEFAKAERQKLIEFNNKLLSLQNENTLSQLQAGYDRELKQLQIKIANEKRANQLAFEDKKLTKAQQSQLDAQLDIQLDVQKAELDKKRNEEAAKKEADFQKELGAIKGKAAIASIIDTRQTERVQLEIGYEEKLQDAIARYQNDQAKLQQIKLALDEQLRLEQEKLDEKFRVEDEKKAFEIQEQKNERTIANKLLDTETRIAAVDNEQALLEYAFDNKIIAETEYNSRVAQLAEARKQIKQDELEHNLMIAGAIADGFGTLSEIAGKQTVAGKALAIAQTTINTIKSGIAAFAGMVQAIPGPVGIALGVVAAAGAVAAGVAAVKKIVAVQVPGQGGGGGAAPSNLQLPTAPVAPTAQSTLIAGGAERDINTIAKTNGRAYVLNADVQNENERQVKLERAATLGG